MKRERRAGGLWGAGTVVVVLSLMVGCAGPSPSTHAQAGNLAQRASGPILRSAHPQLGYVIPDINAVRPSVSAPRLTALHPYIPERTKLPNGFVADRIIVEKTRRSLHLMSGGRLVKTYRVSLGFSPEGHKQRQGDGRTPEGEYFISERNPHSRFHRSLRISYPDAVDRLRARSRGEDPGGDIMIHGLPNADDGSVARMQSHVDWTLGCVAVNNVEMDEIWGAVPVGTPIEIRP